MLIFNVNARCAPTHSKYYGFSTEVCNSEQSASEADAMATSMYGLDKDT